ncbi:6,7-dimethyl-8-ribityllumazine synthase [Paraburkholderia sp. J76]|uniref:6,7-dimethyl-8-ribityllumazine synthase n=1 Tax=Paraburkholderia sp. J76 TaxID=2805439 RepID=UPI002ABDBA16|nr:6,7-dimethyl-8-ribityllumazine synthase [Paraburkholderia sp. J76]
MQMPTSRQHVGIAGRGAGRIAFIGAGWHRDIVDQCREAFVRTLSEGSAAACAIDLYEVPGVFEIPLHAKLIAQQGRHAAIVAAGFVVDGGIYRHDFVSQTVIQALMQVQLETTVPVISAVLTPHHFHGSPEHVRFFREHFVTKGTEAAHACAAIVGAVRELKDALKDEPREQARGAALDQVAARSV